MASNTLHPRIFPQLRSYARLNSLVDRVDVAFYDVKFYPFSEPDVDPVFAVVGGPEAIVCRPISGENGGVEVIAWFHDEEPDASLNSVTWSQHHETGDPLLIVSGTSPIIKIFDVKADSLVQTLVGHGKGINDLAVSPASPQILASASMDKSVRFWSLDPKHAKQPTMLICGGEGHKESILTFAFHPSGRFLLTGGMDHIINLWLVPDLPDAEAGTDHPAQIRYPHFTSSAIHTDYVDCVAWYGDLILSKCAREHTVVLWRIEGFSSTEPLPDPFFAPTTHEFRPTRSAWNGSFQRLLEFSNPDCDLFFIRFTLYTGPPYAKKRPPSREPEYMSPYAPSPPSANGGPIPARERPILAVGNEKSKISFWDLSAVETWSGEPDDEALTKTGKKRGRPSKHGNSTPASVLAARNRRKEEMRGPGAASTPSVTRQASNEMAGVAATGSAALHPHPLSNSQVAGDSVSGGRDASGSAEAHPSSPSAADDTYTYTNTGPLIATHNRLSSLPSTPLPPGSGAHHNKSNIPSTSISGSLLSNNGATGATGATATAGAGAGAGAGPAPSPSAGLSLVSGTPHNANATANANANATSAASTSSATNMNMNTNMNMHMPPSTPSASSSTGPPATAAAAAAPGSAPGSASASTPGPGPGSGPASAAPGPAPASASTARAASKYSRGDPFYPLAAHRSIPIPKTTFAVRAIAWSNDGSFAVGVGDQGVVALFSR